MHPLIEYNIQRLSNFDSSDGLRRETRIGNTVYKGLSFRIPLSAHSRENVSDNVAMDIGQATLDSVVVIGESLVV